MQRQMNSMLSVWLSIQSYCAFMVAKEIQTRLNNNTETFITFICIEKYRGDTLSNSIVRFVGSNKFNSDVSEARLGLGIWFTIVLQIFKLIFCIKFSNSTQSFLVTFSVAASANGVFTSPEIAKSFDFTSEERIYNWYFVMDTILN